MANYLIQLKNGQLQLQISNPNYKLNHENNNNFTRLVPKLKYAIKKINGQTADWSNQASRKKKNQAVNETITNKKEILIQISE